MNRANIERIKYIAIDFIMANIAIYLFDIARYSILGFGITGFDTLWHFIGSDIVLAEQIVLPLTVMFVHIMSGFYNKPFHKSNVQTLFTTFAASLVSTLLIYFVLLVDSNTSIRMTSYELLLYLIGALFSTSFIGRVIVNALTYRQIRKGNCNSM